MMVLSTLKYSSLTEEFLCWPVHDRDRCSFPCSLFGTTASPASSPAPAPAPPSYPARCQLRQGLQLLRQICQGLRLLLQHLQALRLLRQFRQDFISGMSFLRLQSQLQLPQARRIKRQLHQIHQPRSQDPRAPAPGQTISLAPVL